MIDNKEVNESFLKFIDKFYKNNDVVESIVLEEFLKKIFQYSQQEKRKHGK